MTQADEDTNWILTDNDKKHSKAIPWVRCASGNVICIQADFNIHPDAPRCSVNRNLETTFLRMCQNYRDPNYPPFGPEDLIQAVNACLPPETDMHNRFVGGGNACAIEFLSKDPGGLLFNIALDHGFLVHYMQRGQCNICGQHYQEVHLMYVKPITVVMYIRCFRLLC